MYQILHSRLRMLASAVLIWHLGLAACSQNPRIEEEQLMRDENIEAASIPAQGEEGAENSQDIGWMQSNKQTEEEKAANADLPDSTADQFKEELTAIDADEPSPVAEAPATEEIAAQDEVVSNEELTDGEPKANAIGEYVSLTPRTLDDADPLYKEEEKVNIPKPEETTSNTETKAATNSAHKDHTTAIASSEPTLPDGTMMKYVIVRGDTLGKISAKIYGTTANWRALATINNLANPDLIYPGEVISFESNDRSKQFEASYYGSKQKIVVQNGDTLQKIAKRVFGTNTYWKTLWKFNSEAVKDPNYIHSEQVLYYVEPLTSRALNTGGSGTEAY